MGNGMVIAASSVIAKMNTEMKEGRKEGRQPKAASIGEALDKTQYAHIIITLQ